MGDFTAPSVHSKINFACGEPVPTLNSCSHEEETRAQRCRGTTGPGQRPRVQQHPLQSKTGVHGAGKAPGSCSGLRATGREAGKAPLTVPEHKDKPSPKEKPPGKWTRSNHSNELAAAGPCKGFSGWGIARAGTGKNWFIPHWAADPAMGIFLLNANKSLV